MTENYGYRAAQSYINTLNLTRDKTQAWNQVKATLTRLGIAYEEHDEYLIDLLDDHHGEQTIIFNNTIHQAGLTLPGDQ